MNKISRPTAIALIVFAFTGCLQSGSKKSSYKSYNATFDDPSEEQQDSYDTIVKNVPMSQMPNMQSVIDQVNAEHPGILNCDCAGFQKLVMASLRQKDKNWGFCLKDGSTLTDRFMYGKSGPLADAITNVCSGNSSVWWNPEPNDPGCIWSATQQNPESTIYSCGGGGGNTGDRGGSNGGSVPDHSAIARSVAARFPNLGPQYCAEALRQTVTELRKTDTNWGYCNKPHKNKVPTDILMYRSNSVLVDFVVAVCDPGASVGWSVLDGNPDSCIWGETANFPIPSS